MDKGFTQYINFAMRQSRNGRATRSCITGFTLIEVLIYSALIAVFIGSTIAIAYNFLESGANTRSRVKLAEQQQFLRQKIEWVLRGASTINSPPVGSSGTSLSVNKSGSSENPFVIDLSSGVVRLQTASHGPLAITDPSIAVSGLTFDNFAFSQTTKNTVRVRATLTTTDLAFPVSSSMDIFISIQ